jgi:hypothetical protein
MRDAERQRKEFRSIETGDHYESKYNMDQKIYSKYGNVAKKIMQEKYRELTKRKRDLKVK